ncbi:ETC complex I subunit [Martelella alba]|uniref:ETC complex I subunit n=1 Tax=Martelella alba TaxID=2590451 RepID=A0A506UAS9_9HYPH|nr:ETC complex I subunit [Martelella alba]TPW29699.1 ETC complex I subunit [Martelella alba]
MPAKIYRPARTAMQQGQAKTHEWVLEFEQAAPRKIDPVFGYTSSTDTLQQVKLRFETQEEAEDYARRHGIAYRVMQPKETTRKAVSYSDNFRSDRAQPWTH